MKSQARIKQYQLNMI